MIRNWLQTISSKSRCIFEPEMADALRGEVSITNAWALDEELLAEGDRKAEGFTFDDHGGPLVALDAEDRVTNGFLPERLERDSE